ncbi:MAG: ABC transporter substrate-binding protein [Deltaproteobacteria bacterium]|jgi:putative ABC transport system substrate-binding protein|nr:ABC transporter substrate-binding protein [Deltaproteobacteria bacterium]
MKTLLCLALASCVSAFGLTAGAEAYTVSINQFVEHPSLNEAVRGFKEQLAELGLEVTYHEHNAQADMPTVTQIVNQIVDEKPDLVLAVATPSAQITAQRIKDTPILFTAVTDPVDAKLVASAASPGANVSGTTDLNPVSAQLALIKEIQPQAKNIGIVYNSGESNSVVQVELARRAAAATGFELIEAVTADTAGVMAAAQSLVGKVDAIYLPTDNSVIASLEAIIKVSLDHKIPIYPAEDDSVRKGGAAVLSISYYQLGRQTGRMAARILKDGAKPASMPVEEQTDFNLIINTAYAAKVGLQIPDAVAARASETIEQ